MQKMALSKELAEKERLLRGTQELLGISVRGVYPLCVGFLSVMYSIFFSSDTILAKFRSVRPLRRKKSLMKVSMRCSTRSKVLSIRSCFQCQRSIRW